MTASARHESSCGRWHSHRSGEALHSEPRELGRLPSSQYLFPSSSHPRQYSDSQLKAQHLCAVSYGSLQAVIPQIPRLSCSGYPRSQAARPATRCEGPHCRGRWYRLRTSYAYPVTPNALPHDNLFGFSQLRTPYLPDSVTLPCSISTPSTFPI